MQISWLRGGRNETGPESESGDESVIAEGRRPQQGPELPDEPSLMGFDGCTKLFHLAVLERSGEVIT